MSRTFGALVMLTIATSMAAGTEPSSGAIKLTGEVVSYDGTELVLRTETARVVLQITIRTELPEAGLEPGQRVDVWYRSDVGEDVADRIVPTQVAAEAPADTALTREIDRTGLWVTVSAMLTLIMLGALAVGVMRSQGS